MEEGTANIKPKICLNHVNIYIPFTPTATMGFWGLTLISDLIQVSSRRANPSGADMALFFQ